MLNRLSRYIAKHILLMTGLVLLIVLGIQMFIAMVREFGDIGQGDYTVWQAFLCVLYDLPRQVYLLFPMAGLMGSLLGLGQLASHSELIVMRAAGMSISEIFRAVLVATLALVVVFTFVGEVIAPLSAHHAELQKTTAQSGGRAIHTRRGLWIRSEHKFIYIQQVLPHKHLEGIVVFDVGQNEELKQSLIAASAVYQDGQWILRKGKETLFEDSKLISNQFDKKIWQVDLKPKWLQATGDDPDQMNLPRLVTYISYLKANDLASGLYALSFWSRLFQPLATAVMILLAIPFIFGSLRSATMGSRMIVGIVFGFSFFILNKFFGPFGLVFHFPPIIAALLPIAMFSLVGFAMIVFRQ